MNKNIVYCLCAYLSKDKILVDNMKPVVNDIKEWAESKGADFKLITKIPNIIEDMFGSITNFYKNNQIQKYKCIKNTDCNSRSQTLKAWNTKFNIIEDFYKSNYEKMMYFDCDVIIRHKHWFQFEDYNKTFFIRKINRGDKKQTPPIVISEKYLNRKITGRFAAGQFFIDKQFEINLSKMFSYDNIYRLWKINDNFLREETSMTYLIHKNNIEQKITQIHFPLIHIGNNDKKLTYIHNEKS